MNKCPNCHVYLGYRLVKGQKCWKCHYWPGQHEFIAKIRAQSHPRHPDPYPEANYSERRKHKTKKKQFSPSSNRSPFEKWFKSLPRIKPAK